MLHTIRQLVNNDEQWRGILRGLNERFRHQTVMGADIETYIATRTGLRLGKVFDQYLRSTMVPTFEYRMVGDTLHYRWANVVPGFDMPLRVTVRWPELALIYPTTAWQTMAMTVANRSVFRVDENFYVTVKNVGN